MEHGCKITKLANGVDVLVRPVSPHTRRSLHVRVEDALPPRPQLPVKQQRSVDGHTEETLAQEGDPEYEQWKKDVAEWHKQEEAVKDKIEHENLLRFTAYAVAGWRWPTNLLIKALRLLFPRYFWSKRPPRKWQPVDFVQVPDGIDRRALYVLTEIISSTNDYGLIEFCAVPELQQALRQEEVGRQLDGFQPDS